MIPDAGGFNEEDSPAPGGITDVAGWATASVVADRITEMAAGASEAASESAASAAVQAQRLLSLDEAGDALAKIVERWGGTGQGQFAGRIFEWQHVSSFNVNAAGMDSPLRAVITEFPQAAGLLSDPHGPVDAGVLDQRGDWLVEAQAKVLNNSAQRLHQLAQDKYEGLRLLVPSDHRAATESFIDARTSAASPGFLKEDAYQSVKDRLTDHLEAGGVQSDSISNRQLQDAARDPEAHLREWQQRETALRSEALDAEARNEQLAHWLPVASVAGAAFAGGAAAAATTAFVRSVTQIAAVRSGELTPSAAAMTAANDAAAAFARGALVGGGGQSIALLSQGLNLPDALGGGTLPFAMARASLALGEVTLAYAHGKITATEAAQQSADSVARISVAWAGSLIGQILIPIPVVGAVIGGTVGSLSCALAAQGIAAVNAEMRGARQAEEALAAAQVELAATLIVLEEQLRLMDQIGRDWDIAFSTQILPSLNSLEEAVPSGNAVTSLEAITTLIRGYQGAPLFATLEQFDQWMRSTEPLVLRTSPRR